MSVFFFLTVSSSSFFLLRFSILVNHNMLPKQQQKRRINKSITIKDKVAFHFEYKINFMSLIKYHGSYFVHLGIKLEAFRLKENSHGDNISDKKEEKEKLPRAKLKASW